MYVWVHFSLYAIADADVNYKFWIHFLQVHIILFKYPVSQHYARPNDPAHKAKHKLL